MRWASVALTYQGWSSRYCIDNILRVPASGGLTLGQTGFTPAGRQTKFHGIIASSHSLQALEGVIGCGHGSTVLARNVPQQSSTGSPGVATGSLLTGAATVPMILASCAPSVVRP